MVDPGEARDGTGASHLDRLLAAAPAPRLVLVTHRHHDHVALADRAHEATGAPVRAVDPVHCREGAPLGDGEIIEADGLRIRVLATPGHTDDSVCFVLSDEAGNDTAVLTGDTVLGQGTSVVAHPDGMLGPYLSSLERLRDLGPLAVLPGHGPELASLADIASAYLAHRAQRLDQVRAALSQLGPGAGAREVVEFVYADVDRALWWAAELSVRAQLDYLHGAFPPPDGPIARAEPDAPGPE
jgi:glyoxylase-like metal-dependent hydrolase (beta-lactamase superfamily II)